MKISVIIPVYNSGQYLNNLLSCIDKQTFDDFEIVFVDDGSTDDSFSILKEYADGKSNVCVYTKENGGVSDARNFGIERASGEYLVFWDADDDISPLFLSEMYSFFSQNPDKLCMCAFEYVVNGEKSEKGITQGESVTFFSKNQAHDLQYKWLYNVLWNKIFSAKIIKDNDIRFTKGMTFGEDTVFVSAYAKYVSGYAVKNKCFYTYYTRDTNASQKYHKTKFNTVKSYYNNIIDSMDMSLPDYADSLIKLKEYTFNDFIGVVWHYCKFYKTDKDNKRLIKQTLIFIKREFKGLYKVNFVLKAIIKLKSVLSARIYYHFLKKI